MVSLAQLRCLAAVAEELNLRRAARRLNMTQPPLTRHIQALEHAVGTALLDRSRRAIRLTPAGVRMAEAARQLLEEAETAMRDARRIAAGDAGSITIGFTAASSYAFLPSLVASMRQNLPALSFALREMTTPLQIAALRAGQIDLSLARPPLTLAGMRVERVHRERLVVAAPARHGFAGRPSVALEDLAGETLITYPPVEGPYFHRLITGLLHAAGVSPAGLQYITQTHSILALVGAGLGVALVPEAAERCLPAGVVLRTLAGAESVHADLVAAWPASGGNPACETVLRLIRAL